MRVLDRNGAGPLAQSSDGTGTDRHVGIYSSKILTDGGPLLFCPVLVFPGKPAAGKKVGIAIPGNLPVGVNFDANFANSSGWVYINPTATATFNIYKSHSGLNTLIGTAVVSTGGFVTFTTDSGNPQSVASIPSPSMSDAIFAVAPTPADATMSDVFLTLYGRR